jgi:Ran-binding protein 1
MADAETKHDVAKAEAAPSTTDKVAEAATAAKDKVAETASTAKDNVFSMFGGGPKKDKKVEEDDVDEPSGSAKAQLKKEKEAEVRHLEFYTTPPLAGAGC